MVMNFLYVSQAYKLKAHVRDVVTACVATHVTLCVWHAYYKLISFLRKKKQSTNTHSWL